MSLVHEFLLCLLCLLFLLFLFFFHWRFLLVYLQCCTTCCTTRSTYASALETSINALASPVKPAHPEPLSDRLTFTIASFTALMNPPARAEQKAWFLIAQTHDEMTKWMTSINAQIYSLFLENFTPPEDNYWGQG